MAARKLYEDKIMELVKNLREEDLAEVVLMIQQRNTAHAAIDEICGKYSYTKTSSNEFAKRKVEEKRLDR